MCSPIAVVLAEEAKSISTLTDYVYEKLLLPPFANLLAIAAVMGKKKGASKTSFRTDAAREAMLEKHRVQAHVALILNETDQFHP